MKRKVSYSVANFAAKFCNELGTNKTSICSPLSAEMVLALLALGCKNQTREELLLLLDVTDDKAIRSSYKYLTSTLKGIKGTTLNLANKVYLKEGGELKPGIKEDAKKIFQASLEQLDFDNKEAAAKTINNWVAQNTNNKITNIVSPDMFTENTRILLVNAIYFQGLWVNKFKVAALGNSSFLVNKTTKIHVPMISSPEEYFNYGTSQELKAELGVKTIFDDKKADINMLKSNEKLFVSDAIQKALIIVDENGTEATASTTSNVQIPCCARSIKRFEASHPFLYLLTARTIPLFIGIYEGSEYAEVPSERNDLTEYDMALLKRLSEVLNQRAPLGAPSI
ncbi:antichymotrypsin-2-like isoform X2 [Choristoneura fumiferana]|uniref:antichymotrypsin-2-like isoform X2 n=1 Tax=Choristoneura fumiferana TaxID=7141 RepID=UPI003D15D165